MKIVLVYPGHSWATIDVAIGYETALRALGHEVKTYNYHKALEFYQDALDAWRAKYPGAAPDLNQYLIMGSERVIFDVLDMIPDVVLIVSGHALHRRAYDLIHRLAVPIVLILTESPYLDEQQALMITKGHVALTFTNDEVSTDRLPGRVEYLPHSFDPQRHYPRAVDGQHRTDLFFHGTLWPERRPILQAAREAVNGGIVRTTGVDPSITTEDDVDAALAAYVDNEELARFYSGTRIALNHHRTFIGVRVDGRARHVTVKPYSLGPRAYEIAACGAFQLCDDSRGELWDVFGDSVAIYDPADLRDLRGQIRYYLDHDDERAAMAAEAHRRVQCCTFEHRAKEILIPAIEEVI